MRGVAATVLDGIDPAQDQLGVGLADGEGTHTSEIDHEGPWAGRMIAAVLS